MLVSNLSSPFSLKVAVAAVKIKQQLDDAGQRVRRVHQEWEEREHLLSHCIQGHALLIDCKKVCSLYTIILLKYKIEAKCYL